MPRTGSLETQTSLDAAMERVEGSEWVEAARKWIAICEVEGRTFSSDDLRILVGDPPGVGNALGALLAAEVRAGRLEVVGRVKSSRPGRHRARIQVYRGRSA